MALAGAYGIKIAATTAGLGPLSLEASGTAGLIRRAKLLMSSIGCSDAPLDHTFTFQIQRQTATGTGSTITLATTDSGDLIADVGIVGKQTLTVTPTITASTILYRRSANSKYGFDFYPVPGAEIIYPAVSANGIVWDTPVLSTAGDTMTCFAQMMEL